jgi:hypothetical protein
MGLLAAVEAWVNGRDHEAEWRMWEGYLETIRQAVETLPSVQTEVRQPGFSNVAPILGITWDAETLGCTGQQIADELMASDPPIVMPTGRDGGLAVMPYMMEAGEAEIVAARLLELMKDRPGAGQPFPAPAAPEVDITGIWQIDTQYSLGSSKHSMVVEQEGADFSGDYRSQFTWTEVSGSVSGKEVSFSTTVRYEASRVPYRYTGTVEGDTMRGTVEMGEYYSAEWEARKLG